jgi:hypothetical protein
VGAALLLLWVRWLLGCRSGCDTISVVGIPTQSVMLIIRAAREPKLLQYRVSGLRPQPSTLRCPAGTASSPWWCQLRPAAYYKRNRASGALKSMLGLHAMRPVCAWPLPPLHSQVRHERVDTERGGQWRH